MKPESNLILKRMKIKLQRFSFHTALIFRQGGGNCKGWRIIRTYMADYGMSGE